MRLGLNIVVRGTRSVIPSKPFGTISLYALSTLLYSIDLPEKRVTQP